jgi:mono/diheme cytochrome c family protein
MRKLLFAVLLVGATGCQTWYNDVPSPDDLMHRISWFDHMLRTKAIHPYERADVPRMTPPGTVPVGGGEADWATAPEMVSGPGVMMSVLFDTNYANHLVRPTTPAGPGARGGQELFETYCRPCHGDAGAGDGPVTRSGFAVLSLLTDRARNFTDGYIYSMIRYGRGLMPRYGDKIVRPDERWAVVEYVRLLQARAAGGGQ